MFSTKWIVPAAAMLALSVLFSACKQVDIYEKNVPIPRFEWQYSFEPAFDFEIKDTASGYLIYVVLRHTDAYRYNNIWLNLGTRAPGDTATVKQRLEIALGNDEKGWEGTGMDDIWELRKPVTKGPVHFKKQGTYHFSIAQIMRENPLPHVMNVGLRIERVK